MGIKEIVLKPWQWKVKQERKKYTAIVCPRTSGKSVLAQIMAFEEALSTSVKKYRIGYFAPEKEQAMKITVFFDDLLEGLPKNQFHVFRKEGCITKIIFLRNKASIELFGLKSGENKRGGHYNHVLVDEMADVDQEVFESVLLPTIGARDGKCTIFGTLKPGDYFGRLIERWKTFTDPNYYVVQLKPEDVGMPPETVEFFRKNMTKERFLTEIMCEPVATSESFFFAELLDRARHEGRIGEEH